MFVSKLKPRFQLIYYIIALSISEMGLFKTFKYHFDKEEKKTIKKMFLLTCTGDLEPLLKDPIKETNPEKAYKRIIQLIFLHS